MTYKSLVPRGMIPQIYPVCPRCGAGSKAVLGTAHADGYHRRHVCNACQYGFYSLAPYEGGEYQISPRPFKDRELTEFEEARRLKWWSDHDNAYPATAETALPREAGEARLPRGRPPPFLSRIGLALRTPAEKRTRLDKYIVAGYEILSRKVEAMEATTKQETTNGRQET